jgi:predicted TIM-barrel fold metal-dependent hydrolase
MPHPAGGEGWSWAGEVPTSRFSSLAVAGRTVDDIVDQGGGLSFDQILPGNYDPAAHLADMDRDGVDAIVVYPAETARAYIVPDRELALACIRAYNDWMLEDFESYDRHRIIGLCMLPTEDGIDVLLDEFRRVTDKGARALFLPGLPERPYHDAFYDPLWQRASAEAIPLSFHRTFGGRRKDTSYDDVPVSMLATVLHNWFSAVDPFSYMIFGGVFSRFPNLRIVAGEVNCGWMPFWLQMMDQMATTHRAWGDIPFPHEPSAFVGENVFVTVLNDPVGFEAIGKSARIGSSAMFSNDYPHSISLWPHSQEYIAELTNGLAAKQRHDVLAGNALRVYDFTR